MEREKRVVKGNKKFDLNDIKVSKEAGVSRLEQLNVIINILSFESFLFENLI